jgi:replicative DNA helicase
MGEESTGMRWSQMIGSMTTRELRSGVSTQRIYDLDKKWQQEESIPLWMLFAPKMRADQLKASIAYMVKKNNIGLVVIDHLRRINMNDRYQSDNSLDEARITYLKADICKSLGVSVIAIAHTSKARASRDDKKPRMSDLSGSQMIAAEVDYLAFVYRPYEDLSDAERSDPSCYWTEKDGYLVWRKNRNDKLGDSKFYFDGSTMSIEDVKPQIQQPTPRGHELW